MVARGHGQEDFVIQGAAIGLGALFMECNKVECPEVGVFVRVCVLRLMFVSVEMIVHP